MPIPAAGPDIVSRYLRAPLGRLATDKFVLLSGPRQVGKTTLAREWLALVGGGLYLNWDVAEDRARILKRDFLGEFPPRAIVLDEIHKYPKWKGWLKGLFDRQGPRVQVVVTGSARLDMYQRGGDSLLGRQERLRLHPLTTGEVVGANPALPPDDWLRVGVPDRVVGTDDTDTTDDTNNAETAWSRLERRGGFPEPWSRDDPAQHRRWTVRRRSLLVREDIRDLTQIRQIALVEHLALLLPERVGSTLSVNSLREDLQVGHDTVSNWLDALEVMYYAFRIAPHTHRVARTLTKERKLYLWDWSEVPDPAARFENMVASHLLKSVHYWNDLGLGEFDLRYLRDKEKREVDFVVTERRQPVVLIEAKVADQSPSESLKCYQNRLGGIPAIQVVRSPSVDRTNASSKVRVVSASRFFSALA